MTNNIMQIGIMSREAYKKRTIAIARGDYLPSPNEPKVWFESIKSLAQILSAENQELLRIIVEHKPESLTQLAQISARKKSNLSRTLKTLENYGVVELRRERGKIVPIVRATDFRVEFGLNAV